MTPESISVVVIGRNEGLRLKRCLDSIRQADWSGINYELIYVDSASSDNSVEIALSFGARCLSLKPSFPTAALARNAGWQAAVGHFVFFLDGDTVLHPQFVKRAIPAFVQEKVGVVWGHRREINVRGSIYNRVLDLDWIYPPGLSLFCGGDAIMRREALERSGGFDESLVAGEEPELCARLRGNGWLVAHVDLAMTGHDLDIRSLHQYWRRAFRAGYAYREVSLRRIGLGVRLWQEDARRNRSRVLILFLFAFSVLACSILFNVYWSLAVGVATVSAILVRSAWRARWKSSNPITLILYAIHSHLQQIPIFWGQLCFVRDQRSDRKRHLIEYKIS